jgi:Ala-tRNA(Pro) deacylase
MAVELRMTPLSGCSLATSIELTGSTAAPVPPIPHDHQCPEDAATHSQLTALLSQRLGAPGPGGRWSTSEHAAVRTSEEAAAVRGVSLASGAKAMLLSVKPGDAFVLAVISAAQKMDSKAFKKAGGFKSTRFASEQEVRMITGCVPGAVPPFGSLWSVRTYVERSLLDQGESINFNAGLRTHSVSMRTADYLELEGAQVASFR